MRMRLVVHRTFLTLVADDDDSLEPHSSRSRSAPATLHHTDRPAERDAGVRPKTRRKKQAKGGGDQGTAADAEDSDDVFEEYAAIVAQEVALLSGFPPGSRKRLSSG